MGTKLKLLPLVPVVALLMLMIPCIAATMVSQKMGNITFECPEGWQVDPPYCYLFASLPLSLSRARESCKPYGAELVEIQDEAEAKAVGKMAGKEGLSLYWIGNAPNDLGDMCKGFWDVGQPLTPFDAPEAHPLDMAATPEGLWQEQAHEYQKPPEVVKTILPFVCRTWACVEGTFRCKDGKKCISNKFKCDGAYDCEDQSDENDCSDRCTKSERSSTGSGTITANVDKAGETCVWYLEGANPGKPLSLKILNMNVEKGVNRVEVWGGGQSLSTSKLLQTLDGTYTTAEEKMVFGTDNFLIVRIVNDQDAGASTFEAEWEEDLELSPEVQNINAGDDWTEITSPYLSKNKDLPCSYTRRFTVSSDTFITMEILESDIRDGLKIETSTLFGVGEAGVYPETYISYTNTFTFEINAKACPSKFKARVKKGCTVDVTRASGFVKAPTKPVLAAYVPNMNCKYVIRAPANDQRPFSLSGFYKFPDDKDALKIYDGNSTGADQLSTQGGYKNTDANKGTKISISLSTSGPVVLIEFITSRAMNSGDFRVNYDIECPQIDVNGMTMSSTSTQIGSTNTLSCLQGFEFSQEEYMNIDQMTLECVSGGKWNVTRLPTCQDIYCGIPELIPNGYISDGSGNATYGATVTYKCFLGFNLTGSSTSTCGDGAKWSAKPSCEASKCQPLQPLVRGSLNKMSGDSIDFGTIYNFTCEDGYELIGSRYTLCQSDGAWSHQNPTCTAIKCPVPVVERGMLTYQSNPVNESSEAIPLTEALVVTCEDGYVVNGTNVKTESYDCQPSGAFNFTRDVCVDKNECDGTPCTESNTKCVNTEGSYRCDCKDKYQKGAGDACEAIKRCALGTSGCDTINGKCIPLNDGEVFKCECNEGYVLFTENGLSGRNISDIEDGVTSGDVLYLNHTCVPVTCSAPSTVNNGALLTEKKMFDFGEKASYRCDFGYELTGSEVLTCNASGHWDNNPPVCNAILCDELTPQAASGVAVYPSGQTSPGEEVKLECTSQSTDKPYNKTLFCGYDQSSKTFKLLGDTPTCPLIDCGTLTPSGGAKFTLNGTGLNDKFTFECHEAYKLQGNSTSHNNEVMCEKNGRWGLGNLHCSGERCTDPGTPGGTNQISANYELGGSVIYNCIRAGYKATPENRTCKFANNQTSWDSSPPTCVDAEVPVFLNCPTAPIKLKLYETAESKTGKPQAEDNSGLVYYSLDSLFFRMDLPLEAPGLNVTYTATDAEGKAATCVLDIRVNDPGTLPAFRCKNSEIAVQNSTVVTFDISSLLFDVESGLTMEFDMGPEVTVAPDKVGFYPVRATGTNEFGLQRTCAFTLEIKASVCLQSYIEPVENAVVNCKTENDSLECNVTCNEGFAFADGTITQTYGCQGTNNWTPSLPASPCLASVAAKFVFLLNITYSHVDGIEDCQGGIDTKLKARIPTQNVFCFYDFNQTMYFDVVGTKFGYTSPQKMFVELSLGVRSTIDASAITMNDFESCKVRMEVTSNLNGILRLEDVSCTNKTGTHTFDLKESTLVSADKVCPEGSVRYDIRGISSCVKCAPGSYFDVDKCVPCLNSQYQDLAGQTRCKSCDNPQQFSVQPRSSSDHCLASCPLGFANGETYTADPPVCVACSEDEYLDTPFTASCKPCGDGKTTFGKTGATECIDKCGKGQYPLNNTHCVDCPVGFYKGTVGNTVCTKCPSQMTTSTTGSVALANCSVLFPGLDNCTNHNEDTSVTYCICEFGYEGEICDNMIDVCLSSPCYNGGTCNATGVKTFSCACPEGFSGTRCEVDDKNNCTDDTCDNIEFCRDLINSADCVCPSDDKYTAPKCYIDLNLCTPNPCKNDGACVDSGNGVRYTCTCKQGFTGDDCETNIDECKENPQGCLYGGNCTDAINGYTCTCQNDHTGNNCEEIPDYCKMNPGFCENGLCYNDYEKSSAVCVCEFPYRLDAKGQCEEIDICNEKNPCQNNATCSTVSPGVTKCMCQTGYNGSLCQHNIDDCAPGPCKNGKCKDLVDGYECDCDVGWNDTNCDNNIDDRPKATCIENNTATIDDLVNAFKCVCKVGFTGDNCESDINECLSLPCQHGGTCSQSPDTPGQYTCKCQDGWRGQDCDELEQFCLADICEAGGICHSLQDDFFCQCQGGSTGKNCSTFEDLCSILNPCKDPHTCTREDNKASCSCPASTHGSSCNLINNGCLDDPCKNEGICNLVNDGYSCKCTGGFEGEDCSKAVVVCSNSTCPPKSECFEFNDEAVCLCGANQVQSGNTCKNVSSDFDLFITKQGQELQSSHPFRINSTKMTLMFMVAPLETSDEVPFIQLKMGDGTNLLSVATLNITFLNHGVPHDQEFQASKWNYFTVVWEDMDYSMFLNAVKIKTETLTFQFPSIQDKLVYLSIGANFKGFISQVTVWEKPLNFSEVLAMVGDRTLLRREDLVAQWGHYRLDRNIWTRILVPSTVSILKGMCENGKSGDACDGPQPDKEPPEVKNCPTEDKIIVTKRLVQTGDWGITGEQLQTNLDNTLLTFGVHRLVYIVKDDENNVGFCRFNAYVKLKSMSPDAPDQQLVCNADVGLDNSVTSQCAGGIDINCPVSPVFAFSIFSANFMTCGKLGSYNLQNPYMLPPAIICGDRSLGRTTLTVKFEYSILIDCISDVSVQMTNSWKNKIKELKAEFESLCPDSSCSNFELTADPCQGKSFSGNVVLTAVPKSLRDQNGYPFPPKEILERAILEDDEFSFSSLYSSVLKKSLVEITEEPSCQEGSGVVEYGLFKGYCVKCTKGSYVNEKTKTCAICPLGSYTDTDGAVECKQCPGGKTTLQMGASTDSECVNDCVAGNAFNSSAADCQICPKDFYSNKSRQVFCNPCPANTDSESEGTTSRDDCYETCEAGTELNGAECVPCPRGTYSDGVDVDRCEACPEGKTTPGSKSTSKSSCSQDACDPGFSLNQTSNVCEPCPHGFFQPEKWQNSCHKCNASYTTQDIKSTSAEQCLFTCRAGKESLDNTTCIDCKKGFYRTASMDDRFKRCTACNNTFTTADVGSESSDSCAIRICTAGNYREVADNLCYPCAIGKYQSEDLQTECVSCPDNTTTKQKGSNSRAQCLFFCDAGQEVLSAAEQTCKPCQRGQYKSNDGLGKFEMCESCSENTTNDEGSTSAEDCNIHNCTSGQKIASDGSCEDCLVDTFQNKEMPNRNDACQACPNNTGTKEDKRTSAQACKPFCDPGEQYDEDAVKCVACPVGTYNNGNASQRFEQCTACADGYVTADEKKGVTSATECTLRDCPVGKFIKGGTACEPCPLGEYQDELRKMSCKKCKADTNTSGTGSTKESDCTISCDAGKEQKPGSQNCTVCDFDTIKPSGGSGTCQPCTSHFTSNDARTACDVLYCDKGSEYKEKVTSNPEDKCEPCLDGTYKDARGNSTKCTACPLNTTTTATGAKSEGDCNKANCDKGFYSVDDTFPCQPCPLGTFKDAVGNQNCTACNGDYTTSAMASTNSSECTVVVCPVGKKRNAQNTCEDCLIGFFQNETGQTTCHPCASGYTTIEAGKSSENDCRIVCSAGSFRNDSTNTCEKCPVAKFQSASGKTTCTDCQSGYTTADTGSKNANDCYVVCAPGKFAVSRDQCSPCPFGQYQSAGDENKCSSCGSGKTTLQIESTSADDCMPLCGTGEYLNTTNKACLQCPLGTYNADAATMDKTIQECTQCPEGNTTTTMGADSADDCNLLDCLRGSKRSTNGGCEECPLGTYQPNKSQFKCISCGPDNTTFSPGRFFEKSCISKCEAGTTYDVIEKKCKPCPVNFIRVPSQTRLCPLCPTGKITLTEGKDRCVDAPEGGTPVKIKQIGIKITVKIKIKPCKDNAVVNKAQLFNAAMQIVYKILEQLDNRFNNAICQGRCRVKIKVVIKTGCLAGSKREKRATTDSSDNTMELEIPDVNNTVTEGDTGNVFDTIEVVKAAFFDPQVAQDIMDEYGIDIQDVLDVEALVTCSPGEKIVGTQCEPCAAGTYSSMGVECNPCGINTYQSSTGQSSCLNCTEKTYTSSTGATSASLCLRKCAHANARDSYCSGHGACVFSASAADGVQCDCDDSYSGTDCSVRDAASDSNTELVAAIVGGVCAFLIILLIIFGVVACLRRGTKKAEKNGKRDNRQDDMRSEGYPNYNHPAMFEQPYMNYPMGAPAIMYMSPDTGDQDVRDLYHDRPSSGGRSNRTRSRSYSSEWKALPEM